MEPATPATVNVKELNFALSALIYAEPLDQERYGAIASWIPPTPSFFYWDIEERFGHVLSRVGKSAFLVKRMAYSSFGFKINFGSNQEIGESVKTKVLSIQAGVQTEIELITLAPLGVGQSVEFCFPIADSEWVDPDTGFLYFKPSGKTFGNVGSFADLIYGDKLKSLFYKLHSSYNLLLYDKNGMAIAKTTPAADWHSLARLALPYHPGAATYAAGSAGTGETNWTVGMVAGTSQYNIPLMYHSHVVNQFAHKHDIIQTPHSHDLDGYTYDTEASEGNDGSGSAYAPVSNKTKDATADISMSSELVNLTIESAGGDASLVVQTPGYGVEKMIFTGVKIDISQNS